MLEARKRVLMSVSEVVASQGRSIRVVWKKNEKAPFWLGCLAGISLVFDSLVNLAKEAQNTMSRWTSEDHEWLEFNPDDFNIDPYDVHAMSLLTISISSCSPCRE